MSTQRQVCLKHRCLARNCKCGSPLAITIGYRTRIPPKNRIERWKQFIDYINGNIKANNEYRNDNYPLLDKEKIVNSWK